MSILASDLKFYASDSTPDDDIPTAIGGAIDTSKKFDEVDFGDSYQIVSSHTGDTTQTVTLSYLDGGGLLQTEDTDLNGQTVVTSATVIERLMKAVKDATCAGDVALEAATAVRTATLPAQSGLEPDQIALDAGASSSDGAYTGMVFRVTSGTGIHKIVQIIDYVGATKLATVSRSVSGQFDNTSVFRISKGFFFDKTPSEIMEVRRPFYNAQADDPGGDDRTYYDKGFWKNTHATITLTTAVVKEISDPTSRMAFGLGDVDGTDTNGGGNNRLVAPAGYTFDSSDKNVPGGSLAAGEAVETWMALTLPDGTTAAKTTYRLEVSGATT